MESKDRIDGWVIGIVLGMFLIGLGVMGFKNLDRRDREHRAAVALEQQQAVPQPTPPLVLPGTEHLPPAALWQGNRAEFEELLESMIAKFEGQRGQWYKVEAMGRKNAETHNYELDYFLVTAEIPQRAAEYEAACPVGEARLDVRDISGAGVTASACFPSPFPRSDGVVY